MAKDAEARFTIREEGEGLLTMTANCRYWDDGFFGWLDVLNSENEAGFSFSVHIEDRVLCLQVWRGDEVIFTHRADGISQPNEPAIA